MSITEKGYILALLVAAVVVVIVVLHRFHCVALTGIQFRDPPASAFQILGLKNHYILLYHGGYETSPLQANILSQTLQREVPSLSQSLLGAGESLLCWSHLLQDSTDLGMGKDGSL